MPQSINPNLWNPSKQKKDEGLFYFMYIFYPIICFIIYIKSKSTVLIWYTRIPAAYPEYTIYSEILLYGVQFRVFSSKQEHRQVPPPVLIEIIELA